MLYNINTKIQGDGLKRYIKNQFTSYKWSHQIIEYLKHTSEFIPYLTNHYSPPIRFKPKLHGLYQESSWEVKNL